MHDIRIFAQNIFILSLFECYTFRRFSIHIDRCPNKGKFDWTDPKTGYIYARVVVKQLDGPKKTIYRRAVNVTHAKQLAQDIKTEYESRGQAFIDGRQVTFKKLADWYKDEFVIAPVYVDGQKVEGMRTCDGERLKMDRIIKHLGDELINEMDETVFRKYRKRLRSGVTVTTVNRDFQTIRAMFRKAKRKKWIKEIPDFEDFIQTSLERRRTVTITETQEVEILKEARKIIRTTAPRLYALILALRDFGARPN